MGLELGDASVVQECLQVGAERCYDHDGTDELCTYFAGRAVRNKEGNGAIFLEVPVGSAVCGREICRLVGKQEGILLDIVDEYAYSSISNRVLDVDDHILIWLLDIGLLLQRESHVDWSRAIECHLVRFV